MYSNHYSGTKERTVKINSDIFRLNNRMFLGTKGDEESILDDMEDEREDAIKKKIEHLKEDEKGPAVDPVQYTKVLTSIPGWAFQTFSCCGKSAVDDEEESKMTVVQQRNIEAFLIVTGAVVLILLIYVFGKTLG